MYDRELEYNIGDVEGVKVQRYVDSRKSGG